jgi:hypothetical protein
MEYTKLGRTGLDVSRICLGCMSYGGGNRGNHAWSLGEEESRPFIHRALARFHTQTDTLAEVRDSNPRALMRNTTLTRLPRSIATAFPSATRADAFARGTDGSNPSPSSRESGANLTFGIVNVERGQQMGIS